MRQKLIERKMDLSGSHSLQKEEDQSSDEISLAAMTSYIEKLQLAGAACKGRTILVEPIMMVRK